MKCYLCTDNKYRWFTKGRIYIQNGMGMIDDIKQVRAFFTDSEMKRHIGRDYFPFVPASFKEYTKLLENVTK